MAGIPAGWQGEIGVSANTDWSGQTIHATCLASTGGGYPALYTNGVFGRINQN